MGFQRPTYRLVWPEGHELHGLEIRTRGLSFADLKVVSSYGELSTALPAQQMEAVGPLLDIFTEKLIGWNFEDDEGRPIGTSREDITQIDVRIFLPILLTWMSEVSSIPDPLPKSSSSGAPSLEESIPMDVSSPSPTSSPTPS